MANAPEMAARPKDQGRRRKPLRFAPRIDFTPMVDLGFLLITFFMLTTELNKPNLMSMTMPKFEDETVDLKNSQVLTLLLGSNDKVYWYEGVEQSRLDSTDFSASGLRNVILAKKDKVKSELGEDERPGNNLFQAPQKVSKLYVLIKSTDGSTYKNLVDALDEMKICEIGYYTIMPIATAELAFIQHPENGLNLTTALQKAALRH